MPHKSKEREIAERRSEEVEAAHRYIGMLRSLNPDPGLGERLTDIEERIDRAGGVTEIAASL